MLDFMRQLDIVSPEELANIHATVIGTGGIGSPTTLALAKMGVSRITVYDPDNVEPHNLPSQILLPSDLGRPKVESLQTICRDLTGTILDIRAEAFESQQIGGVVLSGVDSMQARKQVWERVRYNPQVQLYVEARMAAEVGRIHTVYPCDPDFIAWYETTLYSDEAAVDLPCTAQAIVYNVFVIAGLMANQVKKFAKAEPIQKEVIVDLVNLLLLTQ